MFDEKVQKILKEYGLTKRYPKFSANLTQGPSIDGVLPNGGGEFLGNINKMGPNTLVGNLWYQKKQTKSNKKTKK